MAGNRGSKCHIVTLKVIFLLKLSTKTIARVNGDTELIEEIPETYILLTYISDAI